MKTEILNKTITTKFAGQVTIRKVGQLLTQLLNQYEVSNNKKQFVENVISNLLTEDLSKKDKKTLEDLYVSIWCSRY